MIIYILFSYIAMSGMMVHCPLNVFAFMIAPLSFPYYLGKFLTGRKL